MCKIKDFYDQNMLPGGVPPDDNVANDDACTNDSARQTIHDSIGFLALMPNEPTISNEFTLHLLLIT